MKIKQITFYLLLCFSPVLCFSQSRFPMPDSFLIHQNEQLRIAYQNNWTTKWEATQPLTFATYLPKRNGSFISSPTVSIKETPTYQNSNNFDLLFERMLAYKMEYETVSLVNFNGLPAILKTSGGSHPDEQYTIKIGKYNHLKFYLSRAKADIEPYRSVLDSIKKSLVVFTDNLPPKRYTTIEVSSTEELKTWRETQQPYGTSSSISKWDKILKGFNNQPQILKLLAEGIEINDWNTFFAWKQQSIFRDSTVFEYSYSTSEAFDIFTKQVQLSKYDTLVITEIKPFYLQFDFIKDEDKLIRWIILYETKHPFSLNNKIDLNKFTFKTISGFTRRNGKIGEIIEFKINDQVYTLRVEDLRVY